MSKVQLTNVFEHLKFDEIKISTQLAEDYIKTNEGLFRSLYFEPDKTINKVDSYSNVIECVDSSTLALPDTSTLSTSESWTTITERLKKLAFKIEEKSDVFCQLEWLIRRVSIDNSEHSIQLIVKNLLHASADWKAAYIEEGVIAMNDSTPMLILGFAAQIFKTCDNPIIVATPQTAVVCHLFTKICHEIGWNIRLILIDQLSSLKDIEKSHKVYPNLFNKLMPEITGIITERSDLDSGVDVFLNSELHPIPLTRLLVQESAFEEFVNNLDWKCKLRPVEIEPDIYEHAQKCSKVFKYGDKIFLINYAGNYFRHGSKEVVFVETFRTIKELLSLITNYKHLCLSIWASSSSEANEIALNVNVPVIWINDYCNFTGPEEVSNLIYKRIDSVNMTIKMKLDSENDKKSRTMVKKKFHRAL